ncbi:MAG TPA: nickel insertion protein, partial [Terriglobales bacterium]|nr:nickel insertion protein [Terriglobales bacterium]
MSPQRKHANDSLTSNLPPRAYGARGRIAYLDCFSGISGDMFLGALIDAGVPSEVFLKTVRALDLGAT